VSERSDADPDLADCLDRFYDPAGPIAVPPVNFRPAIDELDDDLLSRALGSEAREAIAYLRDCYRRLG